MWSNRERGRLLPGLKAGVSGTEQRDDYGAVAKYILVLRYGFNLAAAADPIRDQLRVDPGGRVGARQRVPITLAD